MSVHREPFFKEKGSLVHAGVRSYSPKTLKYRKEENI